MNKPDETFETLENQTILATLVAGNYEYLRILILDEVLDINQKYTHLKFTLLHLCVGLLGTHFGTDSSKKDHELFELIQFLLEKDADPYSELDLPTRDKPIDILNLIVSPEDFDDQSPDSIVKSLQRAGYLQDKLINALCVNRKDFFASDQGKLMHQELTVNFSRVFISRRI